MTIIYVATSQNRLKAVEVGNETGKFVRVVQDIDPIVQSRHASAFPVVSPDDENNAQKSASDDEGTNDQDDDKSVAWWLLGSHLSLGPATTEWIERHPTFDSLLYVFTSFGSEAPAVVTTFRILGADAEKDGGNAASSLDTSRRGQLKKLGSVQTQGLHVSHVTFSPDHSSFVREGGKNDHSNHKTKPPSTMCVGHLMDGSLSFFDCSQDAALGEPVRVVVLPEVRPETRSSMFPNPLPSIQHVTYNPRPIDDDIGTEQCIYLLVSDTSKQARVWTYAVDSIGLPVSNQPISFRKVTYITPPSGWFTRLLTSSWFAGLAEYRIRRCVVHPHGRYVYMLLEFNAVIQVYEMNPMTGRIAGDCLQEVTAIDPDYFRWKKTTGAAVHASAELYATATEVFVSNRGFDCNPWGGGSVESGVRIFAIEEDGAKLVPKQFLRCGGPVRHFLCDNRRCRGAESSPSPTTLFVGSDKGLQRRRVPKTGASASNSIGVDDNTSGACVEVFLRRDPEALGGRFERIGLANVGMDNITCIAVLK